MSLPLPPALSRARWAVGSLATLMTLALTVTAAAVPAQAARAAQKSLEVGPDVYVAGQAVVFEGALGSAGEQRVNLQMHMGRPGDSWKDVPDTNSVTDSQGAFHIVQPAPAMFNISYRVASSSDASPAWKFRSRSQEILLSHSAATPGQPFRITADTSPPLKGGGYDLTPPIFAGRGLTLQERTGITWSTLATTTIDDAGFGEFEVIAPTDGGGEPVYRVRAEDYFEDGHQIGWFPSFPLYVPLDGTVSRVAPEAADDTADRRTLSRSTPTTSQKKSDGLWERLDRLPLGRLALRLRVGVR